MDDQQAGSEQNRVKAHILANSAEPLFRRSPRQERARFTVDSILEAAVVVIDEVGWSRASTNRIAERAGVSIGSLYQYFANKEAILEALIDHHRTQVHQVVNVTLVVLGDPRVPVAEALRGLFDGLVNLHRSDPVLARVLTAEVPDLPTDKHSADEAAAFVGRLEHVLRSRPDSVVADPRAAAHVLVTTCETLSRWLAHAAPPSIATETLIDEMVAMLAGYVTGRRPARSW